jgi:hypothetical protein
VEAGQPACQAAACASAAGPASSPSPAALAARSSRWPCTPRPASRCAMRAGGVRAGPARPWRRCGKTAPVAVRAQNAGADVCVNCYRMPDAVCSVCARRRECNFAATIHPVCPSCTPKATAACAHCGQVVIREGGHWRPCRAGGYAHVRSRPAGLIRRAEGRGC